MSVGSILMMMHSPGSPQCSLPMLDSMMIAAGVADAAAAVVVADVVVCWDKAKAVVVEVAAVTEQAYVSRPL
ncbi:unnamed protein product [Gongylonema pulchrum]|uniref:Secreted protein n=1 Tax=Gongylonema pulchrum TaxID=637853 RepID=A0A183DLP6_9BILA|nr:unnamed protein product [Gongylonema pulchrum]